MMGLSKSIPLNLIITAKTIVTTWPVYKIHWAIETPLKLETSFFRQSACPIN